MAPYSDSSPLPPAFAGSASDVTLERVERKDELLGWRLRHRNGEIVATDGGQGYENAEDLLRIGSRIQAGYRLAALSAPQVAGVIREAVRRVLDLEEIDAPLELSESDAMNVAERIALEVVVALFEVMGRPAPDLIG